MIINWESYDSRVPLLFNRRQLLKALFASTAVVGLTSQAAVPVASAKGGKGIDKKFLLQMAKDIYPHDGFLDDKPYVNVVDGLIKEAGTDAATDKLLTDGLTALNASAKKIHGKSYTQISSYGAREALLRHIELGGFFQKVRGGLLFGLYNNKDLFPKFGYEGSSHEHGGYIDRGFSDMTWLPQDPRVKGGKK